MHLDNVAWTAFTCHLGHFEWFVMPFNLKNSPAVFQRTWIQLLVSIVPLF
jgi:hypothetical protein